jgi:type III secretory pathway component EscS
MNSHPDIVLVFLASVGIGVIVGAIVGIIIALINGE